jgi:Domain of unknown function (DUF1707)
MAMSGDPRVRASDADRERTAALLREHHAVGRLTAEEFSERVDEAFAAKTVGDLEVLLADLPAIDLYQLPAAGIRPAPPGTGRRRGGPGLNRRGDGAMLPRQVETWLAWTAASALLLAVWLGIGIAAGGAAWLPWFLLIVIPWGLSIARRPPNHS